MTFSRRLFKPKFVFGVLAALFALSVFGNCLLSLNSSGLLNYDSASGMNSENSQNEYFNTEKGEVAFFSFSVAQTQQHDSNVKTKKSESVRGIKSFFRSSQQEICKTSISTNFVATSHTRFRRTCPNEDAIS